VDRLLRGLFFLVRTGVMFFLVLLIIPPFLRTFRSIRSIQVLASSLHSPFTFIITNHDYNPSFIAISYIITTDYP